MKNILPYLKSTFLIFTFFTSNLLFGQIKYDPKVLILSPYNTECDDKLQKELDDYNTFFIKNNEKKASKEKEHFESNDFKEQAENFQLIDRNQYEYSTKLDFYKHTSYIAGQHITYTLYQKFKNLLVLLKDETSDGNINSFKNLAEKEDFQFIVNIHSIHLYKTKKQKYATIRIQLFDKLTNVILLDKEYTGDSQNPGFEFTCEEKTIVCCINNALSEGLSNVVQLIAANNQSLKREKELAIERSTILLNTYYTKSFDSGFLSEVIPSSDKRIKLSNAYQLIQNKEKDKFTAFFYESIDPNKTREFQKNQDDRNINIEVEGNYFDIKCNSYLYIVTGIKYNNKWYYSKSRVTYFNSKNAEEAKKTFFIKLSKWDFFMNDSSELNEQYWFLNEFKVVPDLTKDPKWEKYGTTIWETDEIENRPYIGMYKLIVDQLKEEQALLLKKKEEDLITNYFIPLSEKLKTTEKLESISLKHMSRDYVLIYPSDFKTTICPMVVKQANKEVIIRYFVAINQNGKTEIFEWTFLNQSSFTNDKFGPVLMDQLEKVTVWNYALETVEDPIFWNEKVLKKQDNKYIYLNQVK